MRISRHIATITADKVIEPIQKQRNELAKDIEKNATAMMWNYVPMPVKVAFEKCPGFIATQSSVLFSGKGLKRQRFYFTNDVPTETDEIELPHDDALVLASLISRREDLNKKYDNMRRDIIATLIGCGTYKRVQEQFPEIYPYLPTDNSQTGLMVIPAKLREQVRALQAE